MSEYIGTYKINNENKLICTVNEVAYTDVSSNDKASGTLTFEIISSNMIKLETISDMGYNSKVIGKVYKNN